ncbi:MAG: cell division protein FtsX [Gammaproteobacteria bacterium]|nr:MAG: cell division protein FtsX [Gammaproteobacteria bacterium]
MIKNYALRHIQVMLFSLGQLWRQPISSLMTMVVIGIAISLPSGLYVLLHNVENVTEQWDDASQISLFLQQDISPEQAESLNETLKKWPNISETHYQSSAQSLDEFRQLSGLGDLLDSLPSNPIPAVIIIKPNEENLNENAITRLVTQLNELAEVELAQLDMEWLQRLRSLNRTAQRGISILAILLSLSVLLIIGNTIRLAILSRQSEIRVIKLVGGTNRFIRRPFLYTGFWYGLLGGLVAWIIVLISLTLLNGPVNELSQLYGSQFTLHWLAGTLFLALPFTGLILGVFGAWLAVGRHLSAIEPE